MNTVNDYLVQLQTLTRQNLEILKSINDAFYTKQDYLYVNAGDSKYIVPSFVSLENKINTLQENFENLVNAPASGEAYFNINGNTREIGVRSYNNAPNSIKLNDVINFDHISNNIFKDFLTPVPFIHFEITSIPNDINQVNVKKIIPKNEDLIKDLTKFLIKENDIEGKTIINELSSKSISYGDMLKILSIYKKDIDYIEYDTVKKLPIRKSGGSGIYVIESIIKDEVDDYMDNYITIKLRNNLNDNQYQNKLTYKLFDDTIEKPLSEGDYLTNYDGTSKMQIDKIFVNTNTIKVKVLNGEFMDLSSTDHYENIEGITKEINDNCKIKFFAPVNYDNDKYIDIPLEEDRYIYIAIAPINDKMNIQSGWGVGQLIDTYKLIDNNNIKFDEYYNNNVKNIGDILSEITSMMIAPLSKYSSDKINSIINSKPIINLNNIQVVQINKHLNNSTTIQNIRTLYSQKKQYENKLIDIQKDINHENDKLSSISYDDTTGVRSATTEKLNSLNKNKNDIMNSLNRIVNEIAINVNESEVPIENAKYRIRGYFDYDEFVKNSNIEILQNKNHIRGIKVFYRYKNKDQEQGNALSMNNGFIFSDWNIMKGFNNAYTIQNDKSLKYTLPENNNTKNEPSFNQIDIPISQGETVDIKLQIIYDFGYPYVEITSNWSDIVNIKFPKEYLKDVQILDIINENNNDIETNRFNGILREKGIPTHIDDKIIDQDIIYFHRPESIASGFYTPERRIIPLKDKLDELNNTIALLKEEIESSNASLTANITVGNVSNDIYPLQTNKISVEPYNSFVDIKNSINIPEGGYTFNSNTKVVSAILNINLTNNTNNPIKLYSIFPGNKNTSLNIAKMPNVEDYCIPILNKDEAKYGVWMRLQGVKIDDENKKQDFAALQSLNQFIYFRINDLFSKEDYYGKDNFVGINDMISLDRNYMILGKLKDPKSQGETAKGATVYPYVTDPTILCIDNTSQNRYKLIEPGKQIVIPVLFEYNLNESLPIISKTISFDIRTSLYKDPINYTVQITAKLESTIQDKLITSDKSYWDDKYKNSKYNITVVK